MSKLANHCVFCGERADTREHIFAKCFFDHPYPKDLLTMPSCRKCNNSFSSDEQYLMYLIDYLRSIENNNGEFTREVAKKTFQHNEGLENRMMTSLSVDEKGKPIFVIETERINRVICKIARCLFMYYYKKTVTSNQIECKWSFSPQLSVVQKTEIERIKFTTLQEGLVMYHYTPKEIGFCLSEFFYGSARIVS